MTYNLRNIFLEVWKLVATHYFGLGNWDNLKRVHTKCSLDKGDLNMIRIYRFL